MKKAKTSPKDSLHADTPDLKKLADKYGVSRKHLLHILDVAQKSMIPASKRIAITEFNKTRYYTVVRKGIGPLKTPFGVLWFFAFEMDDIWIKYNVISAGDIDLNTLEPRLPHNGNIVVRTDSGCETGQTFHDLTCDCREQLLLAMEMIAEKGEGLVINIPAQDGRGLGLPFKLATLFLQEQLEVNTVESAGMLAPKGIIDSRTYSGVIGILKFLGVKNNTKINLATNNPRKEAVFSDNGYQISKNVPVIVAPTKHNKKHLKAKRRFLGHYPDKKKAK